MPYIQKANTPARVTGDTETREGNNGKPYRIVPVELPGGRRASAFTRYVPEVDSFVMLEITARGDKLSYAVVSPTVDVVAFMHEACDYWRWYHSCENN